MTVSFRASELTAKADAQAMDTSKLNNAPAAIPIPEPTHQQQGTDGLRSAEDPFGAPAPPDSAYLDGTAEQPSHPTVAETGTFSPGHGCGPMSGQLQRRESVSGRRIIRLASFGGEGLDAKPAVASPDDKSSGIEALEEHRQKLQQA